MPPKAAVPSPHGQSTGSTFLFHVGLYLRRTLRFLKLHLFARLTNFRQPQEERKVIIYADRKVAFLSTLLHLVPLGAALALIILNTRPRYIGNVSTTTLTALQFCAKFLEILTQASIAAVLLGFIRQKVIASSAFPLGGLLAPYQVTDVSYLWSLEFWGTIGAKGLGRWRKAPLIIVIVLAVVLAALVGPSAAVAMIPRQISFQLRPDLVLLAEPSLYYPTEVSLQNGLNDATSASVTLDLSQIAPFPQDNGVPTIGDGDTDNYRAIQAAAPYLLSSVGTGIVGNASYKMWTSMPHRAAGFALYWANGSHPGINEPRIPQIPQPFVMQTCEASNVLASNDSELAPKYISFGTAHPELDNWLTFSAFLPETSGSSPANCPDFVTLFDNQTYNTLGWCGGGSASDNYSIVSVKLNNIGSKGDQQLYSVIACVLRAQWVESNVVYNTSSHIFTSTVDVKKVEQSNLPLIAITAPWAKSVAALFLQTGTQGWGFDWVDNRGDGLTTTYAIALSNIVPKYMVNPVYYNSNLNHTDYEIGSWSPSTQQYNSIKSFLRQSTTRRRYQSFVLLAGLESEDNPWTQPSSLTSYEIQYFQLGYGYDATEVVVKLSLAVLAAYALIATMQLLYSLISGRVGTSWNSVGEVALLFLNSQQPSRLRGTSAGVDTLATYGQLINVRINGQNSAEVVFDTDSTVQQGRFGLVEVNKEYL